MSTLVRPDERKTCRGCPADIVFVVVANQSGKPPGAMPVNADPDPDGNVAVYRDEASRLRGRVIGKTSVAAHETLYMPHKATCPNPPPPRYPRHQAAASS